MDDEDTAGALRAVDGKTKLASDALAVDKLLALFPSARKLPDLSGVDNAVPATDDVERFLAELAKAVKYAPNKRGAGPGGGRSEHWSWMVKHDEAWKRIAPALLQLDLGKAPPLTTAAITSARIIAPEDSATAGKVRPLALGIFLRRCISKAVANTFRARVF